MATVARYFLYILLPGSADLCSLVEILQPLSHQKCLSLTLAIPLFWDSTVRSMLDVLFSKPFSLSVIILSPYLTESQEISSNIYLPSH